jgi:hypothetical protein
MRVRTLALVCLVAAAAAGPARATVPIRRCVLPRARQAGSCGLAYAVHDALCSDKRVEAACAGYAEAKAVLDAVVCAWFDDLTRAASAVHVTWNGGAALIGMTVWDCPPDED